MTGCPHGYGRRVDCDRCAAVDRAKRRDLSWALEQLRDGLFVQRAAWQHDTFVGLVPSFDASALNAAGKGFEHRGGAFIALSSPDGGCGPWTPTQDDVLGEDWRLFR